MTTISSIRHGFERWFIAAVSVCFIHSAHGQSRAVSEGTRTQDANVSAAARSKAAVVTGGVPDGIARIGGRLHYVKDGRATLLTGPQRFAEGISLERNGDLMLADGRLVQLREGRMVTLAGEVRDTPRGVELPEPLDRVPRTVVDPRAPIAPRTTD